MIRRLERAAGFLAEDPVSVRLDKLERLLDSFAPTSPDAPALLASLLSLPIGERYGPLDLTRSSLARTIHECGSSRVH